MQPFTKKAIEIIKNIPTGKVMTYGQIAALAGNKKGARQVVRILHTMSNAYELPWHRVVNVKGEIAILDEETRFIQLHNLQLEGIKFDDDGRIDLKCFRYNPS